MGPCARRGGLAEGTFIAMGALRMTQDERGVTFAVKVIPRAAHTEIVGVENEWLKIRLVAPPVEGKANKALVEFLALTLGVARRNVEIVRGLNARVKLVRVSGTSRESLEKKLAG